MTGGPTADGPFCWNCRDCGFVGSWLTVDGRYPECGGRDLPTQPTEPQRSEPADFGGGESTGVQEL